MLVLRWHIVTNSMVFVNSFCSPSFTPNAYTYIVLARAMCGVAFELRRLQPDVCVMHRMCRTVDCVVDQFACRTIYVIICIIILLALCVKFGL